MLQHQQKRPGGRCLLKSSLAGSCSQEVKKKLKFRKVGEINTQLVGLRHPALVKGSFNCGPFELPLDSVDSRAMDSSDIQQDAACNSDSDSEGVDEDPQGQRPGRWLIRRAPLHQHLRVQQHCSEFNLSNDYGIDLNNSGAGVDMQNLPSIAEQLEKQRTWMTVCFRYRVHWYEAKPILEKMCREDAYKPNNLPLWTRCLKVQLHRRTIFLNAVRAFRNRMQCATSGVRFSLNAFYKDERKNFNEPRDGPEAKPLPFFRIPNDVPDIKAMAVAQMNVFVSNSTSYFDKFWNDSLKEES